MKVKSESEVAQSCPTPSNPMDCSPPGSSVHGTVQARVLEWDAIAFSLFMLGNCKSPNLSKEKIKICHLTCKECSLHPSGGRQTGLPWWLRW